LVELENGLELENCLTPKWVEIWNGFDWSTTYRFASYEINYWGKL